MKARCKNCVLWDYAAQNLGFCRAKAPSPGIVAGKAEEYTLVWPSTGMDDWCDEFSASVMEVGKKP